MEQVSTRDQGSVLGATLLVSGCCIGAGMLGLPVLSAMAGFQPSVLMFIISWLFMTCTGLLLLEVNLWFKDDVSIISMADRTLGFTGKVIAWLGFLFLFYCLMVAYVAGSGELFVDLFEQVTGIVAPAWVGSLLFTTILGYLLYTGVRAVDQFNRILMAGLIATYLGLIIVGSSHVQTQLLQHHDWTLSAFVLPVMIISFGFHNLVPSLTTYLHRDVRKLKLAFIVGSFIPLLMYLVWEWLILGLVPIEGKGGFREALEQGQLATHALKSVSNASWVVGLAQYFAFFALVTSFVAVALSFVDFLADGLKIKKTPIGKIALCLLVLGPPFLFALIYPGAFLTALNFAGGIGAVILFGLLPAAMVWYGRYYREFENKPLVPGGKGVLCSVILFSLVIIILQLIQGT